MRILLSLILGIALGAIGFAWVGGRLSWWSDHQILALLSFGLLGSFGIALVAALALPFSTLKRGRVFVWLALLVVGASPAVAAIYLIGTDNLRQPWLHDVTTDIRHPPAFVFVAGLRSPRDHAVGYGGQRLAALQRFHFPNIQPVEVAMAPHQALTAISGILQSKGVQLVGVDDDNGRIEGTWRSPQWRLHHDVSVRVSPVPGGSCIDVRSASRAGVADLGSNARWIEDVLSAIRSRMDG